jgi:hypothetical protein
MSIKRILVPLPGSVDHTAEIDMALCVAKALGAHVQALFISTPQPAMRGEVNVSETAYSGRAAAAVAPIGLYAEERDKIARDARERFTRACAAVNIPMLPANDEPGATPAASWRESEGLFVEMGSYAEIAVQRPLPSTYW